MYTNNFDGTDPQAYMANWVCKEAPSPDSGWQGNNMSRYCDPAYDALAAELSQTAGIEARAEIAKQLNEMLMNAGAIIPLIHRGGPSARALTLGGVLMSTGTANCGTSPTGTGSSDPRLTLRTAPPPGGGSPFRGAPAC
jgi:peptide/nickel transport system substrate-binding protein